MEPAASLPPGRAPARYALKTTKTALFRAVFVFNLSVSHPLDSSLNRGAYLEMDLQYKNRQRRGKEEKAALPVYENS